MCSAQTSYQFACLQGPGKERQLPVPRRGGPPSAPRPPSCPRPHGARVPAGPGQEPSTLQAEGLRRGPATPQSPGSLGTVLAFSRQDKSKPPGAPSSKCTLTLGMELDLPQARPRGPPAYAAPQPRPPPAAPTGAPEGTRCRRRPRARSPGSQGGEPRPVLAHLGPARGATSHKGHALARHIPPRPPCPHASAANSSRKHILR